MKGRSIYEKLLLRSVQHIFKNFLMNDSLQESVETQGKGETFSVSIETEGTLHGELIITMPVSTLDRIAVHLAGPAKGKALEMNRRDIAGETANQISGTFANQMQFAGHSIQVSPPEFNTELIGMKAMFENISFSFTSSFGGFDVDLYYQEVL